MQYPEGKLDHPLKLILGNQIATFMIYVSPITNATASQLFLVPAYREEVI